MVSENKFVLVLGNEQIIPRHGAPCSAEQVHVQDQAPSAGSDKSSGHVIRGWPLLAVPAEHAPVLQFSALDLGEGPRILHPHC